MIAVVNKFLMMQKCMYHDILYKSFLLNIYKKCILCVHVVYVMCFFFLIKNEIKNSPKLVSHFLYHLFLSLICQW